MFVCRFGEGVGGCLLSGFSSGVGRQIITTVELRGGNESFCWRLRSLVREDEVDVWSFEYSC